MESRTLTELSVVEVEDIVQGELTRELSVAEALDALAENKFEGTRIPTQPNYSVMIDYLKKTSEKLQMMKDLHTDYPEVCSC